MKRKVTVTCGSSRSIPGTQFNDPKYRKIYRNLELVKDEIYEYIEGQGLEIGDFWLNYNANSYKPEKYGYETTIELLMPGPKVIAKYEFSDAEAVNPRAVLSVVDDMIAKINEYL